MSELPADAQPLNRFPALVQSTVARVRDCGTALQLRAWVERSQSLFPDTLFLKRTAFRWKFALTRSGRKVVFFFIKKKLREHLVMRTEVDFELRAVPEPLGGKVLKAADLQYRVNLPSFILAHLDEKSFRELLPKGARRKNTLVMAVGKGRRNVLAVFRPPEKKSNAVVTADRGGVRYCRNGKTRTWGPSKKWPLRPVIELLDCIREWADGADSGRPSPMPQALLHDRGQPRQVVRSLVDGYCEARNSLRGRAALFLPCHYEVVDYRAGVMLRLIDKDTFAGSKEDNSFQLELSLAIDQEKEGPRANIAVRPPDFLVSGDLHQRILAALQEQTEFLEELGTVIGEKRDECTPEEARDFIGRASGQAVVFRTDRDGERDTDIVVLSGTVKDRPIIAFLSVELMLSKVDLSDEGIGAGEGPPTSDYRLVVDKAVAKCLRVAYIDEELDERVVPPRVTRGMLNFLELLKKWTEAVE